MSVFSKDLFFPFGVYLTISPLTAPGTFYPYLGTIGKDCAFSEWAQHIALGGLNNGANYWTVNLKCAPAGTFGTLIATFNTINLSVLPIHNRAVVVGGSFSKQNVITSDVGVWVEVISTGAPGQIYIGGPALKII